LRRSSLRGAILKRAYLEGANLEGGDLKGTYLRGVNLKGAYLKGACLKEADLKGAYLERACLKEADLEGACLKGACLEGADFSITILIDGGTDNRGYRFVGVPGETFRILAGCRWFTLSEAVAHWSSETNTDALARVELIRTIAKARGFISH